MDMSGQCWGEGHTTVSAGLMEINSYDLHNSQLTIQMNRELYMANNTQYTLLYG